jgi:hypothetical protein
MDEDDARIIIDEVKRMSTCNIDHTHEEVRAKLESQRGYLPESLFEQVGGYLLQNDPSQDDRNALFHLLKKYDLAASDEQEDRNRNIMQLITGDR